MPTKKPKDVPVTIGQRREHVEDQPVRYGKRRVGTPCTITIERTKITEMLQAISDEPTIRIKSGLIRER